MADFLDRLGDELARAVRTPIDAAPVSGDRRKRSRLRRVISRRPGTPPAFWGSRASAAALAAAAMIALAAIVVLAGKPFTSTPHSSSAASSEATPSQRAAGSASQKTKPPARHGSGSASHNGPSASGSSMAEAPAPQSPGRHLREGRRIPAGVKAITITAHDPARHLSLQRTLTNHGPVSRVIKLVQSLPAGRGANHDCSADRSRQPVIRMLFRRTVSSPPLARLRIDGGRCSSISLRTHGHATPLSGTQHATERLEALLHSKL